jgi:hypothetical protein
MDATLNLSHLIRQLVQQVLMIKRRATTNLCAQRHSAVPHVVVRIYPHPLQHSVEFFDARLSSTKAFHWQGVRQARQPLMPSSLSSTDSSMISPVLFLSRIMRRATSTSCCSVSCFGSTEKGEGSVTRKSGMRKESREAVVLKKGTLARDGAGQCRRPKEL